MKIFKLENLKLRLEKLSNENSEEIGFKIQVIPLAKRTWQPWAFISGKGKLKAKYWIGFYLLQ